MDMLVLNDSEGLLQSNRRHEMTGGNTFALLAPDADIRQLEEQFMQRDYRWRLYDRDYEAQVFPIGRFPYEHRQLSVTSWITGTMGLLILLVGLLNFFHFLIGSYFNRTKEFSVMKVNGCSGGPCSSYNPCWWYWQPRC